MFQNWSPRARFVISWNMKACFALWHNCLRRRQRLAMCPSAIPVCCGCAPAVSCISSGCTLPCFLDQHGCLLSLSCFSGHASALPRASHFNYQCSLPMFGYHVILSIVLPCRGSLPAQRYYDVFSTCAATMVHHGTPPSRFFPTPAALPWDYVQGSSSPWCFFFRPTLPRITDVLTLGSPLDFRLQSGL